MEIILGGLFFFDDWRHLTRARVLPQVALPRSGHGQPRHLPPLRGLPLPQADSLLPQTLPRTPLELMLIRGQQRDLGLLDGLEE